jgi:hypothetical protein
MKHSMYLHSDKGANAYEGEELGLTGEALDNFMYALYEIEFQVDVNMETGVVTIERILDGLTVFVPEKKNAIT